MTHGHEVVPGQLAYEALINDYSPINDEPRVEPLYPFTMSGDGKHASRRIPSLHWWKYGGKF